MSGGAAVFLFGVLIGWLVEPMPGVPGGIPGLSWLVLPLITAVVVVPLMDRAAKWEASGAALELFPAECEGSSDASLVEEMTIVRDIPEPEVDDTGHAGQPAAASAFQAAVSEAQQKAKTKLTSIIETMRKEAAEQRAAELAKAADRHAEELQQVRADAQAEVTAAIEQAQQEIGRSRQEEAERHTAELARLREELERQYADELERTRTAVVESFEALTGGIQQTGQGIAQDDVEAAQWYHLAVDEGRADAQFKLGVLYHEGELVSRDHAEAIRWFRLAADQGFADAQCALGSVLARGESVGQDYVAAHMWLSLAAQSSDRFVEARDAVAAQMTAEQIVEAEHLACEWQQP